MFWEYKFLESLGINGKISTKIEKSWLEKSYFYIYLSYILAACNWHCCGDYNRGIASVKEEDHSVNAILVILYF